MVTWEIRKGHFLVHDGERKYTLFLGPFDNVNTFQFLPELDTIYDLCEGRGMTPEQTIDQMLRIFHIRRLFRAGYLREKELVMGLIGPRGSGKSVGGSAITIADYLLDQRQCWSNMPIELRVQYRDAEKVFTTDTLDKAALLDLAHIDENYTDGLIFVDEMTMELSEARRSGSRKSLFFDYVLGQIRKLRLNLLYTCQSEMEVDYRLRSTQTDIFIKCADAAYHEGRARPQVGDIGHHSNWVCYDTSGTITGKIGRTAEQCVFRKLRFWNTPFWHCFNTYLRQGRDDVDMDDIARRQKVIPAINPDEIDLEGQRLKKAELRNLLHVAMKLDEQSMEQEGGFKRNDLWEVLGIDRYDRVQTSFIGRILISLGCTRNRNKYFLPEDTSVLLDKLTELEEPEAVPA